MDDVNDDAKDVYRRIEVLTGPGRRRRWSAEDKARIVAETLVPGARVSEVARRWQVCPQQVFGWRHAMRLEVPEPTPQAMVTSEPAFVPIVTEAATPTAAPATPAASVIEVELAGAVVRVVSGMDIALLTAVLRAVRASASPE